MLKQSRDMAERGLTAPPYELICLFSLGSGPGGEEEEEEEEEEETGLLDSPLMVGRGRVPHSS